MLLIGSGLGAAAACGHLPMEELPLIEDALLADGGGVDSAGSVDSGVSRDGGKPERDAGTPDASIPPIDAGCTGVLCDDGIYVHGAAGNNSGDGSRANPVKSVSRGIKLAQGIATDSSAKDIDGHGRILEGTTDIGADEVEP